MHAEDSKKTLYVVGIGPGGRDQMTIRADRVLRECSVIVGYPVYLNLVREDYPKARFLSTPMRQERERCLMALKAAAQGERTAVICSGDSGIYGMAGLTLELAVEFPEVEVSVIPGVTAAVGGAAVLGAPIGHDFAVISLSDLLTPRETIEKRLRAAGEGDFIVCLYNPASRNRSGYLEWACRILMEYKDSGTVCGLIRQIGRQGEEAQILSLSELRHAQADMFTTVIIGNKSTREERGRMVTPRGYTNG